MHAAARKVFADGDPRRAPGADARLSLVAAGADFVCAVDFLFEFFLLLIAILWLLCTVTFLTFANFFLIFEDLSIIKSIKKSFSFVLNNYLYALAIIIIFYVITRLVSYLGAYSIGGLSLSELISNVLIYPYLIVVLAMFLYEHSKRK